jgi:hypothetical protein
MFLDIFNWMLAHAPGFMRPALSWLVDGLRSVTNYISQRWTSLGSIAQLWRTRVIYWLRRALDFSLTFAAFCMWLVVIFVPNYVAAKAAQLVAYAKSLVGQAIGYLGGLIAELRQWAAGALADLLDLLARVKDWAKYWLDKLVVGFNDLLHALEHVLSGPDVLAEWLAGAMWRAMARLVYAQRDRIVSWLTRESVAFTQWLALQVEDIVMRWL